MATEKEVKQKFNQMLVEQLGVSEDDLKPEARFNEDLGADSLDQLDLTMKVEETFDFTTDDDEVVKLTTVQSAIDYIIKKAP